MKRGYQLQAMMSSSLLYLLFYCPLFLNFYYFIIIFFLYLNIFDRAYISLILIMLSKFTDAIEDSRVPKWIDELDYYFQTWEALKGKCTKFCFTFFF